MLKAQDVVVVLKLAALRGETWTYSSLASALGMSASSVHESVQRASISGLLDPHELRPVRGALLELLVHGLRYVFPAERGRATRGVPTATSAAPLAEALAADDAPALVWPDARGTLRGEAITPLHPTVPRATRSDPRLHALLAVVDALRVGSAREREVAARVLGELLSA